jgi:hypothetical protein
MNQQETFIQYQVTTPLALVSEAQKRKLKRDYRQSVDAFSNDLANAYCPGQAHSFLDLLN